MRAFGLLNLQAGHDRLVDRRLALIRANTMLLPFEAGWQLAKSAIGSYEAWETGVVVVYDCELLVCLLKE